MADDRRRDPRQRAEHLKARVRFADKRQFERCYLKDISRGGIFLRSTKPAPLDSPIDVTLELPGGREVKLSGVVVHCLGPEEAHAGQQPGLGVQFNDLDARMKGLLEGLLTDLSGPVAAVPAPLPPLKSGDFEERRTDPRGQRQTAPPGLIPEQPIIEEEFEDRATPPLPGAQKPVRPPTPYGVRAVPAPGPSKATLDTLRRLLWHFADAGRLAAVSYYDVIGVAPGASPIEIQAACEALRRAFDLEHPPQGLGADAVQRVADVLLRLGEIEQTLSDPRRRAEYDRKRP